MAGANDHSRRSEELGKIFVEERIARKRRTGDKGGGN